MGILTSDEKVEMMANYAKDYSESVEPAREAFAKTMQFLKELESTKLPPHLSAQRDQLAEEVSEAEFWHMGQIERGFDFVQDVASDALDCYFQPLT